MVTMRLLSLPVVLFLVSLHATPVDRVAPDEMQQLGTLEVDDYEGLVFFQDPADDGKSYRVTVAISKPWNTPGLKTARFDVWLLAKGGKALKVTQPAGGDVLIEAGSSGATANAIYFFERSVERDELTAVVVSVDGRPTAFGIKKAK